MQTSCLASFSVCIALRSLKELELDWQLSGGLSTAMEAECGQPEKLTKARHSISPCRRRSKPMVDSKNMNEIEVLLVEDNPSDAELTLRALRKNNLANKLVHVKDGAEAIDFVFAQGAFINRKVENAPKVVLLDLKLPKVDGIEVLRR